MKGGDLLVNGTSLYSVLFNTSLNWPINSSALSEINSATPFPSLFLRGGISCLSFFFFFFLSFLTIYGSVEVSGIYLYITYQFIHIQIMPLFNVSLYFPSQRFKFSPKFTTTCLLSLSTNFTVSLISDMKCHEETWSVMKRQEDI